MGNEIIIDDGLKTYDIKSKNGRLLGQFSFNPSDTNIVHRYNSSIKIFEEIYEDFKNLSDSEFNEENVKRIDERAFECIDNLFNSDIASNFFNVMGPFSPLPSGQLYIENVLDVIGKVIAEETGERVSKINKRIKKHTAKYHG